ncbi:MarR family transcriptional regulator, partial [Parabacteroides merdae]|uniref:MarR family transcriptional regulator n=5 Tax=Bacteroidia TaxID=200643 RepID=UPI001E609F3C
LLYLIGTCGMGNSICIDLVQLAEALNMKKPNVSRALKGLVERNIVIRKDGYRYGKTPLPFELHLNFDQINYDLAYNGKTKEFGKKKGEHPQLMQADGETPLLPKKGIERKI